MESDGNRENFVNDGLSVVNGSSSSSSSASGSRWNPTKEQINILENLYRQGLRTPTADQIQEITSRLRAFGHIEGKNVFYWFQNHKARQRQKQKQDNLAYFTSFLHKIQPPIFTPQYPCPNVVCSQYLIPLQSNDISFVPQYHPINKAPNPGGMMRRRPRANDRMLDNLKASITYEFDDHQETLALFPLHPTDILHENIEEPSSAGRSYCSSTTLSSSFDIDDGPPESHKPSYYDFFSSVEGCDHERDY